NAPDADVLILSSDLVLFKIHSKNLIAGSGAFPVHLDKMPMSDPASLEESSEVLGHLFAFLYGDIDHPTLLECDIKLVAAIGLAAHKYLIGAAKTTCFL
ncbi:hypothetical protein DL96DRAFT_1774553, partial [Flagelloscypha sp. PMI_526]